MGVVEWCPPPHFVKRREGCMFQTLCANCGQPRGFARRLGFGTFFMVLITFGLWLFVIPFYPKRCSVCGCVRSATNIQDAVAQRSPWELIGLVVVVLVILVAVFSNKSDDKPTPTPITDNGPVSSALANVETASHVESHELKVSPNYFGGNPCATIADRDSELRFRQRQV